MRPLPVLILTILVSCNQGNRNASNNPTPANPVQVQPIIQTPAPVPTQRDRFEFGQKLRDTYLDHSENIIVKVDGKENEKITLSYILIGDVWIHHFMKESSNLGTLRNMGFKTLTLTDKQYWWRFDVSSGDNTSAGWYRNGKEVKSKS